MDYALVSGGFVLQFICPAFMGGTISGGLRSVQGSRRDVLPLFIAWTRRLQV